MRKNARRWMCRLLAICMLAMPVCASLADQEDDSQNAHVSAETSTKAPASAPAESPKASKGPAATNAPGASDAPSSKDNSTATEGPGDSGDSAETDNPSETGDLEKSNDPEESDDLTETDDSDTSDDPDDTDAPADSSEDPNASEDNPDSGETEPPEIPNAPDGDPEAEEDEQAEADPSAEPLADLEADILQVSLEAPLSDERYEFSGGTLSVRGEMTVQEISDAIEQINAGLEGEVTSIAILPGGTASAAEGPTLTLPVENQGTISGGSFSGSVSNNGGTISGGTFDGAITNGGTISGGTFDGVITNGGTIGGGTFGGAVANSGAIGGGTFDGAVTNSGTISNGTFSGEFWNGADESKTGAVEGGTFNCTGKGFANSGGIIKGGTFHCSVQNDASGAIQGGTFDGEVENNATVTGGVFEAALTLNNNSSVTGATVNGTIRALKGSSMTKCSFGASAKVETSEGKIEVKYRANGKDRTANFGENVLKALKQLNSKKTWYNQKTKKKVGDKDTFGLTNPAYTQKSETNEESTSTDNDETDSDVAATATATEVSSVDFLEDDDGMNIVRDDSNTGADYEISCIPAASGGSASGADRIPGEAAANGGAPAVLYVRAKGTGTQARTLSLAMSEIARLREEEAVGVLLFRSGSATVALDVSELLEGKLPKLMEMMRSWADGGEDASTYDVAAIDFDGAPAVDRDELSEFRLEVRIAPGQPVGYAVCVRLCLGGVSQEIDPLLEHAGVALHAHTEAEDAVMYYLDENQSRDLLDTHRGTVPGALPTEIYEVAFRDGAASVTKRLGGRGAGEFAALCAAAGRAGVYCIGALPG